MASIYLKLNSQLTSERVFLRSRLEVCQDSQCCLRSFHLQARWYQRQQDFHRQDHQRILLSLLHRTKRHQGTQISPSLSLVNRPSLAQLLAKWHLLVTSHQSHYLLVRTLSSREKQCNNKPKPRIPKYCNSVNSPSNNPLLQCQSPLRPLLC